VFALYRKRCLTMRCSGQRLSSRRLQGQALARTDCDQQAARRLRAAADRGRYVTNRAEARDFGH
jgi:hypothetical protein